MVRLALLITKTQNPNLLSNKLATATFKSDDYVLEADFEMRRAVRVSALPEARNPEHRARPYWVPFEDVVRWVEEEPAPVVALPKKGAA